MANVLTLPKSATGRAPTKAATLVARVSCTVNGAVTVSFTRLGGSQKRDAKPQARYESGLGCDVYCWLKLATDGGLIDPAVAAVWTEAGTTGTPIQVPAGILYRASDADVDAILNGTHARCKLVDPKSADKLRKLIEACPTAPDSEGVVRRSPGQPEYRAAEQFDVTVELCTWAL